jgi:hypothetical protein
VTFSGRAPYSSWYRQEEVELEYVLRSVSAVQNPE